MTATVRVPGVLRQWTGGEKTVEVPEATVDGVFETLCERFPGLRERVLDEGGQPQRFLNVYVNGQDIRLLDGTQTSLNSGDELIIMPSMAGG